MMTEHLQALGSSMPGQFGLGRRLHRQEVPVARNDGDLLPPVAPGATRSEGDGLDRQADGKPNHAGEATPCPNR